MIPAARSTMSAAENPFFVGEKHGKNSRNFDAQAERSQDLEVSFQVKNI